MNKLQGVLLMALFFGASCAPPTHGAAELPRPDKDLPAPTTQPAELRTAVFAGGCFWCTEAVFEQLAGVKDVVSGYSGGKAEDANYETVCSGTTNHAESIKITYDPTKISYGELLRVLFSVIDPTTKDRQGPDYGHQYRSAIFYANDQEKQVAEAYIKQLSDANVFRDPIVTTLEPLTGFYPAEAHHQDYCRLNPNQPYIVQNALPKVQKVRSRFKDEVKPEK